MSLAAELEHAPSESRDVVIDRNGALVKVLKTLLVGGGAAFFLSMAVLVCHHSSLVCDAELNCTHLETYPFGIERGQALTTISAAETLWDPGGRQMAIKLALNHTDGSTTEYQGVGKNGERAQKVAAAINAFINAPSAPQTFALREGSIGVGVFLVLMALLGLCALPYVFSKIRLRAEGGVLSVIIERRPLPPRKLQSPLQRVAGLTLHRMTMMDQEFFNVTMALVGGDSVDLGLRFRSAEQAQQRLKEMDAWLERRRAS